LRRSQALSIGTGAETALTARCDVHIAVNDPSHAWYVGNPENESQPKGPTWRLKILS